MDGVDHRLYVTGDIDGQGIAGLAFTGVELTGFALVYAGLY